MYYYKYLKYKKKYYKLVYNIKGGTPDLPIILHNYLLWFPSLWYEPDKELYKKKIEITKNLEKIMTETKKVGFVGNLCSSNIEESNLTKEYLDRCYKSDKLELMMYGNDYDIIKSVDDITISINDVFTNIEKLFETIDYKYKLVENDIIILKNILHQALNIKLGNSLTKDLDNYTLQNPLIKDLNNDKLQNLLIYLYIYYTSEYLLDSSHWGDIGYKKYIDIIMNDINENYKKVEKVEEKNIFILSDSTIDFSYVHNLLPEKYDNPISKGIVNERKKYLESKLIENNFSKVVIDAVGGTGYFAPCKNFIRSYCYYCDKEDSELPSLKQLYEAYTNKGKPLEELINLINRILWCEEINQNTNNDYTIYIVRIIKHFYSFKKPYPKYHHILCFGYENDIKYSLNSIDESLYICNEKLKIMILIFIDFCDNIINNYEKMIKYKLVISTYKKHNHYKDYNYYEIKLKEE